MMLNILALTCSLPTLRNSGYIKGRHSPRKGVRNVLGTLSYMADGPLPELTCFCSSPRLSHIDATIFETSPKVALGF